MSTLPSSNYVSYSPNRFSPTAAQEGLAYGEEHGHRHGQVLGQAMQNIVSTSPRVMSNSSHQTVSSDGQAHHNSGVDHATTQYGRPSLSPAWNDYQIHSPDVLGSRTDRRASRSPNLHVRTISQSDQLARENAQLRRELESLRAERDQTQNACDAMLTELITTQESLQESQLARAAQESELNTFRQQPTQPPEDSRPDMPDILKPGGNLSRNDERELCELRLKCSKLQTETVRMHDLLQQARGGLADTDRVTTAQPPDQQQQHQQQTQLHQQLRDWAKAYDTLQSTHSKLHRAYHETQLRADSLQQFLHQRQQQQAPQAVAALSDARQMTSFWKQNSEKLSRRNKEITEQVKGLQEALGMRDQEVEQARATTEALRLQAR